MAQQFATNRSYRRQKKFYCYNCGEKNQHFSRNCPEEQEYTRCPMCNVVAFSEAGHKLTCQEKEFISTNKGDYELPKKEFQTVRFEFSNIKNIFSAEQTIKGVEYFLVTKFLSIGTNIKLRRIYGSSKLIFEMKMKPAVSLGFGRKGSKNHLASIMFCDDHVRMNHFKTINNNGIVSYGLKTKPKRDDKHDIELKIESEHQVILFSIYWNNTWHANVAMSNEALTIQPVYSN